MLIYWEIIVCVNVRTLLSGYISLANKGSTNPIIQFGEPPTAGCKWIFTFEDENF